jgi:hypothetical protein
LEKRQNKYNNKKLEPIAIGLATVSIHASLLACLKCLRHDAICAVAWLAVYCVACCPGWLYAHVAWLLACLFLRVLLAGWLWLRLVAS